MLCALKEVNPLGWPHWVPHYSILSTVPGPYLHAVKMESLCPMALISSLCWPFLLSHMSNFTIDIPCGMSSSFPHGCSKCQNGTLGLYHSNPTSPSPQIFYSLSIPLSIEPEHLTQDSKALSVWHLSTFHFFLKPTSRCSVLGSLLQLVLLPGVTLLLTPKALAGLSDFSFHISCSKKSSLITPDLEQLNP